MTYRYSLADLRVLMQRLRDPEHGCPWDLQQTFASIVPHTLEEAYEVADAIEQQDWPHLQGELGDLLFQVIFYTQLGEEHGHFNLDSVIDQLVEKLIRRHPHVFPQGDLYQPVATALDTAQVSQQWEAIKQHERQAVRKQGMLADVPRALPALSRAEKLQKRAARVGFDWPQPLEVLAKIEEEINELREAIEGGRAEEIKDELGDLLFAQVNLARHLEVGPEAALRGSCGKFERRFAYIEQQVTRSGRPWQAHSLAQLDQWWDEAKQQGL